MNYTVGKSGEEVKHRRLPLVGLGVERSNERAFAYDCLRRHGDRTGVRSACEKVTQSSHA